MGRKAKIKQQKRLASENRSSEQTKPIAEFDRTEFVQQLKVQGYNLEQIQRSPEIPENRPKPQL
ncbi:MAG TPA: hypothetical protein V6D28_11525 [Leptolyngbyaceae cyanobacterium]